MSNLIWGYFGLGATVGILAYLNQLSWYEEYLRQGGTASFGIYQTTILDLSATHSLIWPVTLIRYLNNGPLTSSFENVSDSYKSELFWHLNKAIMREFISNQFNT